MHSKIWFVAALMSSAVAVGQDPSPPSTQQPAPPAERQAPAQEEREPVWVRRFSAGVTLGVLARAPLPEGDLQTVTAVPAVESVYSTRSTSPRAGYGITAQLALTERFAVATNVLVRRVNYLFNTDIHTGVDNPNTIVDDRRYHAEKEDTRARYIDVPLLVRYYFKDRHDPGPRVFVQGGGVLRKVSRIRSSLETTDGANDPVCCNTTPVRPANQSVRGLVVGFGVQANDPVGVRLVPEVRYTRWTADTFNNITTSSQRHQIEIIFSFTF